MTTAVPRAAGGAIAARRADARGASADTPWLHPDILAGQPRRRAITAPMVVAFVCLGTVSVFAILAPSAGMPATAVEQASAQAALNVGAATLAILCGTVFAMFSRLGGSTEAAWAAAAWTTLGLLPIGIATLWPLIERATTVTAAVAWLQPGARAAVLVLLVMALWTSRTAQPWRRRPTRVLLISVAVTTAATVLLQLVPALGLPFISATDVVRDTTPVAGAPVVLPAVWLALAVAFGTAAVRRGRPLLSWIALACIAFAGTEWARSAAVLAEQPGSVGAQAMQTAGLVCALVGVIRSLSSTVREQRLDLLTRAEAAEAAADDTRRVQREQVHEARNALGGIVNTLRVLEETPVDDATRTRMLAATFRELVRLQHLFAPSDSAGANATFFVTDTVAPLVTAARAGSADISVEIDAHLTAWGSWAATAQAVQNLLENARRHAPHARIEVRASADDGHTRILVADHGPGITAEERESIFTSGVRGHASHDLPGSGLGLAISKDLIERQGGQLWVEDTPGGGATFVLKLPTRAPHGLAAPSAATAMERHDVAS